MENIKLDEKAHERMETILTKIAKEHSIDNVTAIDISLSKDTGLIKFKTAANDPGDIIDSGGYNWTKNYLNKNIAAAPEDVKPQLATKQNSGFMGQTQQAITNPAGTAAAVSTVTNPQSYLPSFMQGNKPAVTPSTTAAPAQETEYTNAQGDRIWPEKNNPGMYWVAPAGTAPAQGKKMQLDPSTLMAKGTAPAANNTPAATPTPNQNVAPTTPTAGNPAVNTTGTPLQNTGTKSPSGKDIFTDSTTGSQYVADPTTGQMIPYAAAI